MNLSRTQIAACVRCPDPAVTQYWPILEKHLLAAGLSSDKTAVAVLATVAVETAHKFKPIHEEGGQQYFTHLYENRHDLGNVEPGDGARFHGRGFIQITGRANYEHFGKLLKVDIVTDPDRALDPDISAQIAVQFFIQRGLAPLAQAGEWEHVRRRVNGGANGMTDYMECVNNLLAALQRSAAASGAVE
jgi:Chitinase class I